MHGLAFFIGFVYPTNTAFFLGRVPYLLTACIIQNPWNFPRCDVAVWQSHDEKAEETSSLVKDTPLPILLCHFYVFEILFTAADGNCCHLVFQPQNDRIRRLSFRVYSTTYLCTYIRMCPCIHSFVVLNPKRSLFLAEYQFWDRVGYKNPLVFLDDCFPSANASSFLRPSWILLSRQSDVLETFPRRSNPTVPLMANQCSTDRKEARSIKKLECPLELL